MMSQLSATQLFQSLLPGRGTLMQNVKPATSLTDF